MKIAIIGGGASGLMVAHFLRDEHDLHIFEKADYLGGNIRTLNRNIKGFDLPEGVHIENGVTGFNATSYPHFCRFLKDLGMETHGQYLPGSLFFQDGRYFQAPSLDMLRDSGLVGSLRESLKLTEMAADCGRFLLKSWNISAHKAKGKGLLEFLGGPSDFATWMRCVCMLSYSMPFEATADYPAEIAVRLLKTWLLRFYWVFVKGGVFAYADRILEDFQGQITLQARIKGVERHESGVTLKFAEGREQNFDLVIFATTPDAVLPLLSDATPSERRRFATWKPNIAPTIAHTDVSMYTRYGVEPYSACDQFERDPGKRYGYNTYLNHCYQLPKATPYSFAYDLEDLVDPSKILDRYDHITPLYTVAALQSRDEIIETNGERHTFHVGAYLGDGLHEGALVSALRVSRLISMGLRTTAKQAEEEMKFKMTA